MHSLQHAADLDRVRANTEASVNSRIDTEAEYRLRRYASEPESSITHQVHKLDREWDIERVIELEGSLTGLGGLLLAALVDRRLLLLPGIATAMLFLHASQGWYPLLPVFRRLGLRSRNEIDRERYAIKALRGDFAQVTDSGSNERATAAWLAVLA
jgi:hypothetical protein